MASQAFYFTSAFALASAFLSVVKTPLYNIGRAYGTWIDDLQSSIIFSALAFVFFSGVETPLYKMGRAYGTWIDDLQSSIIFELIDGKCT